MKNIKKILFKVFLISGLVVFVTMNIASAEITARERQKIENAVPNQAYVSPSQPRTILVMNLHMHDGQVREGHASIPHGNLALKLMGEHTGAFNTIFSNDTLMFTKENLSQFDAICFANTAGVLCNDPTLRQNILDFVREGRGFIGIHAAAATFCQWPEYDQFPEYGRMLGAYEDGGHPWGPEETIYLDVVEPDHPLTQMFGQITFPIQDEVFQFRDPYSRDQVRILLEINTNKTDTEGRRILPARQKDLDFGMSWIRTYGKGRVFYSSLGHNKHIYWNDEILRHFLAGIQYALGDLQADATPSHKLKKR